MLEVVSFFEALLVPNHYSLISSPALLRLEPFSTRALLYARFVLEKLDVARPHFQRQFYIMNVPTSVNVYGLVFGRYRWNLVKSVVVTSECFEFLLNSLDAHFFRV